MHFVVQNEYIHVKNVLTAGEFERLIKGMALFLW